jgi:hypothetical protein
LTGRLFFNIKIFFEMKKYTTFFFALFFALSVFGQAEQPNQIIIGNKVINITGVPLTKTKNTPYKPYIQYALDFSNVGAAATVTNVENGNSVTEPLTSITRVADASPISQLYLEGLGGGLVGSFQFREGEEAYFTTTDPLPSDQPHAYGSERPANMWINTTLLKIWVHNGTNWLLASNSSASSGITSLNGSTAAVQSFSTSNTGTNIAFMSVAGVHTLNIPNASATNVGLMNTGVQTFAGTKTFNAMPILPTGAGLGKVLTSDGTGNTSWQTPSASAGLTSLNGQTNATQSFQIGTAGSDFNIASASGVHTFNLPDAGIGVRGAVSTGTQTFNGLKTIRANSSTLPSTTGSTGEGLFTMQSSTGGIFGSMAFGSLLGSHIWSQTRRYDNFATNTSWLINPNGGNVGIGSTTNPTTTLHINSKTINTSGLRLEQLTSTSPNTTATSYLAVDVSGNVVKGAVVPSGVKSIVQVKKTTVQTILAGANNVNVSAWTDALTGGSDVLSFDLTNGIYTAPRAGNYKFSFKINFGSVTGGFNENLIAHIYTTLLGNPKEFLEVRFFQGTNTIPHALQVDCILNLLANQTVEFHVSNNTAQNCVIGQNGGLSDFLSIQEL